ncbi:DUF4240 domain-containing protein [Nocardia sp. NPDC051981]|uniref:DUF4240 domain-containing protein n=1 Tax=Nocardia sp. NPDC051981 TaxID=3155417 RepID=UPI003437CF62
MLAQETFSRGMYGREVLPVILQPTQQTRYPADARIHSCHSDTVSFVDSDSFWRIIDAAGTDRAPFAEALVDHLADLAPNEILEYQDRFLNIHDALYRWDVWAAAYLIGDGCCWMKQVREARLPELEPFLTGLDQDHDAAVAGLILPYSSGPIEGVNTKTKLIKRQMYGRAGFQLLRHRILLA